MPSQDDVETIDTEGKVSKKRQFDKSDWDYIADYVIAEWEMRKRKRSDRELHWADIDRQVAMMPNTNFKKLPNGKPDTKKMWMSEVELPLQAQALEVCTADARRLMFAGGGAPWFEANARVTDKYLSGIDFQSIILGDETEVPSQINQDNADKLVEGYLLDMFRQTDLIGRMDRNNAEAFKYGMGVGRARMETKNVYIHEARGVRKEKQKIPVLVPCSIKNTYLDEPMPSMHSAQVLGPAIIAEDNIKLENLQVAANRGSSNPDDEDGGWMPANLKGLEADKDGNVKVLEMEGDIVVPRKTVRSIVIPGAIVTVVVGGKDKAQNVSKGVVRFRFRKQPFSSYLLFPYHFEGADDAYPTSPLEKGRPVQIAATDMLNRVMDSAALKIAPPVGYDRTDSVFAQGGGPAIHPYAQWGTTDLLTVYDKVGGDPGAMASALTLALNLYGELTGVLPARLGAQTVSHTTAFAKDAELSRGAVRTVDYVNQSGEGPLVRWLYMAYQMGRDSLKKGEKISFYIKAYGGFVEIMKDHLPEQASFEWFGSGGPQEVQAKRQAKLQSLQLALQMDQLNQQTGGQATIDVAAAIRETLREGGWTDLDAIVHEESDSAAAPPENPGAATVALQQLGLGAGQ